MITVKTEHPEYILAKPIWRLVRDAADGEQAIKSGRELYLPAFVPADAERYSQYLKRAYFMGVTARTEKSMIGMVFRKPAKRELPPQIESLIEDIDGAGQSMDQIAKAAIKNMMERSRHIFLVDYPRVEGTLDAETEENLGLRPVIKSYPPESLINWKTKTVNGREEISLAVLVEYVEKAGIDEFSHDSVLNYRVLRLRDDGYSQQLYDDMGAELSEEIYPTMAGEKRFEHIPLHIAGAENNHPNIDIPPLYDLATLNIAHYQTTADHRENLFIHGQMTLGITSDMSWQEFQSANPDGVKVGARSGHYLGANGAFTSVSAPESSSLRVALQDLEKQMVMIGARLISEGGQAETAEAARINASAESSTLDTIVKNLSEAIEASLEDMALFLGADPGTVIYRLNSSFWESSLTGPDLTAVVSARQAGIFDEREALNMIRIGKLELNPDRTDDEIIVGVANSLLDGFVGDSDLTNGQRPNQ